MLTFNHTCIGSSHLASGKPCQDASFAGTIGDLHLAIVSDGHGGAIHSRSDVGSQLAIYAVQGVIENHPLSDWDNPDKRQEIFQEIVESWTVLTIDHYYDNLTEQEIAQLPLFPDVEQSIRNITVLYGCTLMAACVHHDGWFAFQIGDGKCVTIHPTPSYTNLNNPTPSYTTLTSEPIPTDDRCFLNTTTSLCDPDAATEFRFCCGNTDTTPVAIFLGSDGIDTSWGTEEALHNFYIEVLKHCTSAADVTLDLAEALPRLSKAGSQDDMSVAAIVNKDLLAKNIAHLIRYQIMRCEQDINERTQRQECLASLVISLKQQAQLPENKDNEYLQRDIDYHYRQLEEVTAAIERLSTRLSRLQSQIYAYHQSDLAHPNSPLA